VKPVPPTRRQPSRVNAGTAAARGDDARSEAEQRESIRRLKLDIAIAGNETLCALADRLYKHVVDCIDFGALSGVEEMLWHAIDHAGLGALDNQENVSRRMIQHALSRAIHDPWSWVRETPYGITKQEERAVRFDADCWFCIAEEHASDALPSPSVVATESDDHCASCDELVREWRERHATQLEAAADRRATRERQRAGRGT